MNAIIKKLITVLINSPYLKVAPPALNTRLERSIRPINRPKRGLIKLFTNELTMLVKAPPIITPTAKKLNYLFQSA